MNVVSDCMVLKPKCVVRMHSLSDSAFVTGACQPDISLYRGNHSMADKMASGSHGVESYP